MTNSNVVRLYLYYKKMEKEGNGLYNQTLQKAIKTRGAMNAEELLQARPFLKKYIADMNKAACSSYEEYEKFKAEGKKLPEPKEIPKVEGK